MDQNEDTLFEQISASMFSNSCTFWLASTVERHYLKVRSQCQPIDIARVPSPKTLDFALLQILNDAEVVVKT